MTINEFNDFLQEHGIALYDFGGGTAVMPMVDKDGGSYLTSTVCYPYKTLPDGSIKTFCLEITLFNRRMHQMKGSHWQIPEDFAQKVVDQFEQVAVVIPKEGGVFPPISRVQL